MRVLLLVERFAPDIGGVARSAARTAGALAAAGVEVDVLAWSRHLPPGALETGAAGDFDPAARGATLHRLGLFSSWDLSLQHTLNVLDWLHGECSFDAVWGHYLFPAGFAAVMFAERAGIASTVSARGNDVDQMAFPPGDFARLLWTLDRATVRTAVSRDLAKKIDILLGRDAEVVRVPNAVDLDTFSSGPPSAALRDTLGIRAEEVVLGFCGELRHKKGLPFLLSALAEVRATRPACLLVVGEMRAREQTHLTAFRGSHPEDAARVIVTGRVDDPTAVAEHLRLCDLFLHPSVWDGLPNALLEAMACERVVVCSDAGGLPEVVQHRESGFVIPRHLLHNLGRGCLELLEIPAPQRAAIGATARRRIQHDYHSGVETEALARVVAALAGSKLR